MTQTKFGTIILGNVIIFSDARRFDKNHSAPFASTLPPSIITIVKVEFNQQKTMYTLSIRVHAEDVSQSDLLDAESAFARLMQYSLARHFANVQQPSILSLDENPAITQIITLRVKNRQIR